jgi:hypothetical protein
LVIESVILRPLQPSVISNILAWLKVPAIRESFVPAFPDEETELQNYFSGPTREYFGVYYEDLLVGIIDSAGQGKSK